MKTIPIDAALLDRKLLGAALGDPASWSTWVACLKAAFGRKLAKGERALFDKVAGGRSPPTRRVDQVFVAAGRRSGKSRVAALIASYCATCVDHSAKLSPGETGMVLVLAASRSQARGIVDYCKAFIEASPILRRRIQEVTQEEIRLTGNVVIAVHSNSFRTVRGRTLIACIFDELSFWQTDELMALSDLEAYRAALPSLATTNGLFCAVSSPYRRVGLLATKHRDFFGRDDPDVLFLQGPTLTFNPTLDAGIVDAARAADPASAISEWDAEFRRDLQSYLDDALIDAAIDHGRPLELPPRHGVIYFAFTDASAGRHDAFTICVCHAQGERIVVDVIRGRRPPFDPASVAAEFAALAREYRCPKITGDNFAAEWVAGAFTKAGLPYHRSDATRSEIYLEVLPLWTRGLVSIPNHATLVRELRLLERRTHRSGRDSVAHGAHGSDDYANSLSGALRLAVWKRQPLKFSPELLARASLPGPMTRRWNQRNLARL
jgi:hypothetical protein